MSMSRCWWYKVTIMEARCRAVVLFTGQPCLAMSGQDASEDYWNGNLLSLLIFHPRQQLAHGGCLHTGGEGVGDI